MAVVAAWVTSQLVFNGLIAGLEIGLLAMGIVLIYRSTRVINFAVGNMGLVGASLLALLVIEYDIPFWLAAIGSLIVGTLFGTIMELVVIRRLFFAPRVVVLVSTIGISGLALAIVTGYPEITDFSATYPPAVDHTWSDVLGVRVTGAQLAVLVVVPIVALALGWFLNRTLVGRTVKASAENPDLARVQGINPKLVSTAVWSIAGFLATLTMMLVAADNGGAAKDLLQLAVQTVGDTPLDASVQATVRVTAPGAKPRVVQVKLGLPQPKKGGPGTGVGFTHEVDIDNFRKRFPSVPPDAPITGYLVEAFLPKELGGDFYSGKVRE